GTGEPDGAEGVDGVVLNPYRVTTMFGGGNFYDSSYNYHNPNIGDFSLVPGPGCKVTLTRCTISYNSTRDWDREYGGISLGHDGGGECYKFDSIVVLNDCKFIGNSTGRDGHGGGQCFYGRCVVEVNDCDYIGNITAIDNQYGWGRDGGGLRCLYETTLSIKDSRFTDNLANGRNASGGGLYWDRDGTHWVQQYYNRFNDSDYGYQLSRFYNDLNMIYWFRSFNSSTVGIDDSYFLRNTA
ncbi:unnamed protein product, partial [marine sediment metagenome]